MRFSKFFLLLVTSLLVIILISISSSPKEKVTRTPEEIYNQALKSTVLIKISEVEDLNKSFSGTGSIVKFEFSEEPFILTAGHITEQIPTEKSDEYQAIFNYQRNPETLECCMIDGDNFYAGLDFAVFRFKNDSAKNELGKFALPIGNSESLKTGDPIFIIGTYEEANFIFNSGIVVHKQLVTIKHYRSESILINTVFGFGSSGGPLINKYGELVGLNTSIYSNPNRNLGPNAVQPGSLYISVPIDNIMEVINLFRLGEAGAPPIYVSHPCVGQITFVNSWQMTDFELKTLGIDSRPEKSGVLVSGFMEILSPATEVLRLGDRVISINNKKINNKVDAYRAIFMSFQRKVPVVIERDGEKMTVELKLVSFNDYQNSFFDILDKE